MGGGGEGESEGEREMERERERERSSLSQSVRVPPHTHTHIHTHSLILFHGMGLMLRKRNGTEKNALSFNLFIIITSILFTALWTVKHFCVYIVFVIKVQALTCIAFITAGTNL